jgi:isoquinoline 1-oxidoreductase alpha subunit
MIEFTLNGESYTFPGPENTPLLWVLRDSAGLTGTKYGCGTGLCGACTVHVDGEASRACVLPIEAISGRSVTTIEGLSPDASHPVQRAWREADVPQCGYCQTGQIMAVAAMLKRLPTPSDDDIDRQHTNICRCGAYPRIRRAIHLASELSREGPTDD